MADNQTLVARIYEFREAVKLKNSSVSTAIDQVIIPLLEYKGSLQEITKEKLKTIRGLGGNCGEYVFSVIAGEDISKLVEAVPFREAHPYRLPRGRQECGTNWDGSWDNATMALEDG